MDRRKHLSLLIVRGDGSRIVLLRFPRRLPLVVLTALTLVGVAMGAMVGQWWWAWTRVPEVRGMLQEVHTQRAVIGGLTNRLAELQREVASWHELHARIWEPFGPDTGPKGRGTGIGGARVTADPGSPEPMPPAGSRPAVSDELDRLGEIVLQEGERLRALDRLISRAGKALASLPSRWPVRGAVNSEFGGRRSPWTQGSEFHGGIDIAAERGTQVRAPAAGTVAFAGAHAEYGLAVIVDHGEDLRTIYGHLSKIIVALGQKVARGAELGLTGNTGRSSGPHLHYEILVKNRPVNPRAYFWE